MPPLGIAAGTTTVWITPPLKNKLPVEVAAPPGLANANVAAVSDSPAPLETAEDESRAIELTLEQYKQAFNALDVLATSEVWPTVERRSLTRAFATLKSQSLAFSACDARVQGPAAVVQCEGTVQFVRAVGTVEPRIERQQWTFHLRKHSGRWRIQDVVASPQGRATHAASDIALGGGRRQNAAIAASTSTPRR